MSIRNGIKRIRRGLMRTSTKVYIRLITAFVILGIFISEGSVKDISEAQSLKGAPELPKHDTLSAMQSSLTTESKNRTLNGNGNSTSPAVSSAKISRTLQELLQEATPERIFGFSHSDRNITGDQPSNSTFATAETTFRNRSPQNDSSNLVTKTLRRELEGTEVFSTEVVTSDPSTDSYLNETNIGEKSPSSKPTKHTRFRGVLPSEETLHLFKADNVTHLSFILYRLIKTHNIHSVLDVPCKDSILWMKDLLQILEFEVPHFHYKCLAPDNNSLAKGVVRYQHLSSATVLKNQYPWASRLPQADLALCWYGLGFLPPHQSWGLLKALRSGGVKFVIVPNYPDVRHNPGSGSALGRINVRRAPYRFNEPLRVVNNVSSQASTPKQLLFYDLTNVRRDAL